MLNIWRFLQLESKKLVGIGSILLKIIHRDYKHLKKKLQEILK